MSFPFETDVVTAKEEKVTIPREYEIDLKIGQFTGRIVEGAEAIKVWAWNVLLTPRYRHNIFSWDYGQELEELIKQSFTPEYLNIEAKRLVEDCLLINKNIQSIDNFIVEIIGDRLSISFTLNTLFGAVGINV
ncbi:MAG: Phage-like element protein xkdS [Herbinix sp.]|jgi:hypothetical protein|nr:Phage-like element protein xkdS [Herbinix sp.]